SEKQIGSPRHHAVNEQKSSPNPAGALASWRSHSGEYSFDIVRFVYVMDPMTRILPDRDTTFAFLRAAQRRGHTSVHCEPRDVYLADGDVWARCREVQVSDAPPYFSLGRPVDLRLPDVECVFIRKDPPFDTEYLHVTL